MAPQRFAGRGQAHTTRQSMKKFRPKHLFQIGDALAYRGRRDEFALSGFRDVLSVGDRREHPQGLKVDSHIISLSRKSIAQHTMNGAAGRYYRQPEELPVESVARSLREVLLRFD